MSESDQDATAQIPSDEEVIQKRHLVAAAIERSLPRLLPGIRVYVWRFGLASDRSSVEELAYETLQDTIAQALGSAALYDCDREMLPWLLGIAKNVIKRSLRRRKQEQGLITPVADISQAHIQVHQSNGDVLSEDELFDLVCQPDVQTGILQSGLPDLLSLVQSSDQQILELAYVDGLGGKDLAAALGISEGAAWTRLSRARARLRNAYLRSEQASEGDMRQ